MNQIILLYYNDPYTSYIIGAFRDEKNLREYVNKEHPECIEVWAELSWYDPHAGYSLECKRTTLFE